MSSLPLYRKKIRRQGKEIRENIKKRISKGSAREVRYVCAQGLNGFRNSIAAKSFVFSAINPGKGLDFSVSLYYNIVIKRYYALKKSEEI